MPHEMLGAEQMKKIVFVGAGNVGLQAILSIALVMNASHGDSRRCFVVDFDMVQEKDTRKGYPASLVGRFKAEAAVEVVRILYGKTADRFFPVVAAAQSVPGVLRNAEWVFNGTDSALDAAWVSEQSRNAWEARMSAGLFGETPMHTIEVIPPGFALGEVSYDAQAWADTTRQECLFGLPVNSFAGVSQPFGSLVGALAIHLYQASERSHYRMIRISGDEILQCRGSDDLQRSLRASEELPLSYDETLGALWSETAMRLCVDNPEDMLLEFPIPIVTRFCEKLCEKPYRGFERQPPTGLCCVCGGKTFCRASPREVRLDEVEDIAHLSLSELHAPAGLGFTAHTRDGRKAFFHLRFRIEDIPRLQSTESGITPAALR